jgi:hypothetical protein
MLVNPYCWPFAPCICGYMHSSLFSNNVKDAVRSQHVAVTRDGIKFVKEMHKTGCRMDCQDQGKVSKTVPFDK